MKKNRILSSESGIAHLGLLLVVVAVLAIAGFAAYRVVSNNNSSNTASTSEDDAEDRAVDELDSQADKELDSDAAASKDASTDEEE